jgi:hypothetical protein
MKNKNMSRETLIRKAELKTAEEGFNNLESRKEIEEAIGKNGLILDYVDLPFDCWQNREDTIVFIIKKGTPASFGEFVARVNVDEYNVKRVEGKEIIRLWWD